MPPKSLKRKLITDEHEITAGNILKIQYSTLVDEMNIPAPNSKVTGVIITRYKNGNAVAVLQDKAAEILKRLIDCENIRLRRSGFDDLNIAKIDSYYRQIDEFLGDEFKCCFTRIKNSGACYSRTALASPLTIEPIEPPELLEQPKPHQAVCPLRGSAIHVRPHFITEARQDEFLQLDQAFTNSNVVFLSGIGGQGKSELAKHWLLQRKALFDTIVFCQMNDKQNILDLISDDSLFVIDSFMNRADYAVAIKPETDEEYFKRKLGKIKQICNHRTIIVIDNFSGNENDPHFENLVNSNYKVLVTTRQKNTGSTFPVVEVGEFKDPAYLRQLFAANVDKTRADILEDPFVEKLIEFVGNHTLATEILAKSFVNSVETPESLYKKMTEAKSGAQFSQIDGMIMENGRPKTAFECIRRLFSIAELKDEYEPFYTQVLCFMAAMPTAGIPSSFFRYWSSSNLLFAKNTLVEKGWLRESDQEDGSYISMHPLVKEIIWADINPSIEKFSIIADKIIHDDDCYVNALYHQREELKSQIGRIYQSLIEAFPIEDAGGLAQFEFYSKMQRVLYIVDRPNESLALAEALLHALEKADETTGWRYGYVLYRIAIIHNSFLSPNRNAESSWKYFKEAAILMDATAKTAEEKFWIMYLYRTLASNLTRLVSTPEFSLHAEKMVKKIRRYWTLSQRVANELLDAGVTTLNVKLNKGLSYIWKSKLALFQEDIPLAKDYLEQAETEFNLYGYKNSVDISLVNEIKAEIANMEGDHEAEIAALITASTVYRSAFAEDQIGSIERSIKLALAYEKNGQIDRAIPVLERTQLIARKRYGEQSKWVEQITQMLARFPNEHWSRR